MIKCAFLFALVAAATAAVPSFRNFNRRSIGSRILGGSDIDIENVPWQVAIIRAGVHSCGGSIISENWVLTAAQCQDQPTFFYTVRAGSPYTNRGGSIHSVDASFSHRNYYMNQYGLPYNDIAVLRVRTPFQLDATRAIIPLYNAGEASVPGSKGIASGWGRLTFIGGTPDHLQGVTIPVIPWAECNSLQWYYGGIARTEICTGTPEGGKAPCTTDAGGPLVIGGRLAGVYSWSGVCGVGGDVYSEVASYRSWITQNSGI